MALKILAFIILVVFVIGGLEDILKREAEIGFGTGNGQSFDKPFCTTKHTGLVAVFIGLLKIVFGVFVFMKMIGKL